MYTFAPPASYPLATLHRHAIVLLPQLLARVVLGMVVSISGILRNLPILVVAGLFLTLLLCLYAWMAWRVFSVHIQYDRIVVRRLRYSGIVEDIYPVPGRNGMTRHQSWIGRRIDTGALTLYPPRHTIRLTMLTPFSATADVLGVDC